MKKKNIFLIALTMILCFTFLVPSAWARRHGSSWEGAAIFLGTAFLIDAFVHVVNQNCAYDRHYCPPARKPAVRSHRDYRSKRIWVAPVRERIWHKGYYNGHGRWIHGHWELIHRPGYWR